MDDEKLKFIFHLISATALETHELSHSNWQRERMLTFPFYIAQSTEFCVFIIKKKVIWITWKLFAPPAQSRLSKNEEKKNIKSREFVDREREHDDAGKRRTWESARWKESERREQLESLPAWCHWPRLRMLFINIDFPFSMLHAFPVNVSHLSCCRRCSSEEFFFGDCAVNNGQFAMLRWQFEWIIGESNFTINIQLCCGFCHGWIAWNIIHTGCWLGESSESFTFNFFMILFMLVNHRRNFAFDDSENRFGENWQKFFFSFFCKLFISHIIFFFFLVSQTRKLMQWDKWNFPRSSSFHGYRLEESSRPIAARITWIFYSSALCIAATSLKIEIKSANLMSLRVESFPEISSI